MIKVLSINGVPETTPEKIFGSHFDGEFFYFFESEEEKADFYASIKTWDKEAHIAEINALHSAEYDRRWSALGYEDRTEVATAMANPNCGYQQEAISLNNYWWAGWNAIEDYAETVTEETAQDPIVFISSI